MGTKTRSSIDGAAAQLRDIALKTPEFDLLGSEDEIVARLGVSKATARQAARLLEREGVLSVKRGKKGGYFAARPSGAMIESVMCAYMETLGLNNHHTGAVATALWVEVLRDAASADRAGAIEVAKCGRVLLDALPDTASVSELAGVEMKLRAKIFELIAGDYIELIFRINAAYARKKLEMGSGGQLDPAIHLRFVQRWKMAKLIQLDAIAEGDELAAVAAGLHERSLWVGRGRGPVKKSD